MTNFLQKNWFEWSLSKIQFFQHYGLLLLLLDFKADQIWILADVSQVFIPKQCPCPMTRYKSLHRCEHCCYWVETLMEWQTFLDKVSLALHRDSKYRSHNHHSSQEQQRLSFFKLKNHFPTYSCYPKQLVNSKKLGERNYLTNLEAEFLHRKIRRVHVEKSVVSLAWFFLTEWYIEK